MDKNRPEVSKKMFVEALAEIESRHPKRNAPLRKLVERFRQELEDCQDELVMPYRLRRFFPDTMTFSNFIYEVTWS